MSELLQQNQVENEPFTELKYKKALKRLARLEKVIYCLIFNVFYPVLAKRFFS